MSRNGEIPTLVFAGAGHAHLYSLRRTRELVEGGLDVVLVNPGRFRYYSGMAPGLLSRIYRPEEARIDVRYLVEKGGGRFVKDRVKKIHPKSGEVLLEGGGPAGCEVACNTERAFEEHGIDGRVTIVNAGDALLESAPRRARREIEGLLRSRGVEVLLGSEIVAIEEAAHIRDGRRIDFDVAILAVGTRPPGSFRESGLATGDDDGLWVNRYLQSISDPRIFGGGDSVSFRGESLSRLGVFAIRQGPILFLNLKAYLQGESLKEFKPQKIYLYVLNLGDGSGLAIYGPLAWRSRLAWKLKSYIDAKFVREYQYPEDEPGEARAYLERLPADAEDATPAPQYGEAPASV